MNQRFLPIQTVARMNEVEPIFILNIYYKNKYDERFKEIDGKLFVAENYKYPLADELEELRQKALIVAHNENALCLELAKIGNLKYQTIRRYLYRFTFKHIEVAKRIINLLIQYIERNSLFPVDELRYE